MDTYASPYLAFAFASLAFAFAFARSPTRRPRLRIPPSTNGTILRRPENEDGETDTGDEKYRGGMAENC